MDISTADLSKRYNEMSDEQLTSMRREDLTTIARECYDRELVRRNVTATTQQKTVTEVEQARATESGSEPGGGAAQNPQRLPFGPFQEPRSVWTLDLFQWVLMFVGGWAIVLVNVVIAIPVLVVGYVVCALRGRTLSPHKPLAVGCDVCGQPAVGYKELRVSTGFLMAYLHFWSRGFLCARHTAEYVQLANEFNLIGMFLGVGGCVAIGPFIKSRLQGDGNIRVFPHIAAEPGISDHFTVGAHLYLKGKVERDWDLSREFMFRALASNDQRPEYVLLCRGGATAAQERLVHGSKKELALLAESEEALRSALAAQSPGGGLSEEETSLGRGLYAKVEDRIASNRKRWF